MCACERVCICKYLTSNALGKMEEWFSIVSKSAGVTRGQPCVSWQHTRGIWLVGKALPWKPVTLTAVTDPQLLAHTPACNLTATSFWGPLPCGGRFPTMSGRAILNWRAYFLTYWVLTPTSPLWMPRTENRACKHKIPTVSVLIHNCITHIP